MLFRSDLFNHENLIYVEKYLNDKKITIDILVGGPPCQGFSLSGDRKENDERNMLFTAMVKLAEKIQPKFVVLENVMGMMKLYNGKGAKRVKKGFEEIGYKMGAEEMYAPDYGIPQMRRRVFFVGVLDPDINFIYPKAIYEEKNYITCEQAINDLPSLINGVWGEEQEYDCVPKNDYQQEIDRKSVV